MANPENVNPSQRQAEPTSPASVMERSMQEAKRIRMDALVAAERNHAAMTAATQAKCDEMLAAARRQAEAIVEAARFEAERVRAEVATASHATADGVGQTSAQMILEMSLAEAQQMLTKATEEAERVREYLVADAQATALETMRQAEAKAADLLHQTALQLEVVREQARQIYERLTDVTRDLQPTAVSGAGEPGGPAETPVPIVPAPQTPAFALQSTATEPATGEDSNEEEAEDEEPAEPEETAAGPAAAAQEGQGEWPEAPETQPENPQTPPEASKPIWVIDFRALSAKPPSDPADDAPSSSVTRTPGGEVAAELTTDPADVQLDAAAEPDYEEELPFRNRGEMAADLPTADLQTEPGVAPGQTPQTGADRVFTLQTHVRSEVAADANVSGIKRMLSHL